MSANKSNYRLWVAYLMGPGIIILSQHDLLHGDTQKSLDLFAIAQVSRRNSSGKEKKKKKIGRQAKLPKEISNPWQTLLVTIWNRWKICILFSLSHTKNILHYTDGSQECCLTGFISFHHSTALSEQKAPLHSVTSQSRQGVYFYSRAHFVSFSGKRQRGKSPGLSHFST